MRTPLVVGLITLVNAGTALAEPCNGAVQSALDWMEAPPAGQDRSLRLTIVQLGSLGTASYVRAALTVHSPGSCSGLSCSSERASTYGYSAMFYTATEEENQICENPFNEGTGPVRVTLSLPIGISGGGGLSVSTSSSGTGPTFNIPMSGLTCDSGPMLGTVPNAIFGATKYLIHIARVEAPEPPP